MRYALWRREVSGFRLLSDFASNADVGEGRLARVIEGMQKLISTCTKSVGTERMHAPKARVDRFGENAEGQLTRACRRGL
jgi:hypothetical protein